MSYFNNARHITINDSTFGGSARTGIDKLEKAANSNAMHNSSTRYDPPKCHPGTREAILEHIMQWIFGSDDRPALILWLYGPAGAGKSAILQSIAEKCAALDILLSSFLFSRSDGTRNHPGSLVATIAYQMSTRIPQITGALDAAILRDPLIFDKTLDAQIDVLIVGPLQRLVQSGFFSDPRSAPRLILIDGLDECNDEDHRRAVLRAIARAIRVHNFPLLFLISSRPETDIRFSFDSPELAALWNSLGLDDSYRPDDDIQLFLTESFRWIKETHPMRGHIPSTWPTSSALNTLVSKSSGQFIYASTVIKYISAIRASPSRQLDVILGIREARSNDVPFAEIDALYTYILSSVQDRALMSDILALMMGYFSYSDEPCSLSSISWFLGVDQEDVAMIFSSLASIIRLTNIDPRVDNPADLMDSDYYVQLSHASLSDFLADQNRSGRFHIDEAQYYARLARIGLKRICSDEVSSKNCDLMTISESIFASSNSRPLQIPEDLFRDLESLPLDLMWRDFDDPYNERDCDIWLDLCQWLLPETKFLPAKSATQDELRCQEICVKHAWRIKLLYDEDFRSARYSEFQILYFPALAETLACDVLLNGTRYDDALLALNNEVKARSLATQKLMRVKIHTSISQFKFSRR
ncbi:hypothetical protein HYPSUDRAFT_894535 [Hypholoma sublateritium FD-334 SS-4]|uniref:Nephrocystin 3-like N-terminal domain-containing protein n=1 Tax=Hypholoma sublateritium (strain FD-334 SS-4) TaxID=945553 RepID=A0A0D2NK54_HYPSF|nr:hypothetical protein HYPSUDRAFT_894535 [Hypholoma sublateritium FD-334 SS-4]